MTTEGWKPELCATCGHPTGSHASSRSSGIRPLRFGVCLARGCDCKQFVPTKEGP